MGFVGRSVPRLEDRPLVTGRGAYAADISFPHQLHMRVVRSAVAHGRIVAIDATRGPGAAGRRRGVDVAPMSPTFRRSISACRASRGSWPTGSRSWRGARALCRRSGRRGVRRRPLRRRGCGRPRRRSRSRNCRRCSTPMRPPGDVRAGPFDRGRDRRKALWRRRAAPSATRMPWSSSPSTSAGTPACRWRPAAQSPATMRRATSWRCHGAAKVPHWNRDTIARMLGRAPSSVHLHEGHVGGGFGIRGELYPEDVLVCLAALRLGVPVKWIEDRREHLIAANHSRQQRPPHPRRGRRATAASWRSTTSSSTTRAAMCAPTPRRCRTSPPPCCRGPIGCRPIGPSGHIRLTNKTPGGTYRAPGRYESTFARERIIDAIAARPGLDPIEVRRRNLIDKSEFPYPRPFATLGTDIVLDSGDYARLLDKALAGRGLDEPAGGSAAAPRRRRSGRRRARDVRGEERPWAVRRRAGRRRSRRRGRGRSPARRRSGRASRP